MTQYIARWYHKSEATVIESEPRESFVTADNPSHAEQLIKQFDSGAAQIRLETCSAYKGP